MRRLILTLAILCTTLGCASTITVAPDGSVIAKDYTVTIKADGSRMYAPNRWFTTGFLAQLFSGFMNPTGK